jgi:hypothetical protein
VTPGRLAARPRGRALGVLTIALALTVSLALPAAAEPSAPPGSPGGGTSNVMLDALQAHLATLEAQIAPLESSVSRLQAKVKTQAARLTLATDAAAAAESRLEWATSLLATGEEGGALAAARQVILITAARAASREATMRAKKMRATASANDFLPRLFDAQRRLQKLQAQRDATERKVDSTLATLHVVDTGVSAPAGATHIAYGDWAGALLSTLGLPTCGNNLAVVVAWQVAESTDAIWNPLASTHDIVGATRFNSAGVKNYPSLDSGLQATAQTLWGGYYRYGYGWIMYDLYTCADPMTTAEAINASAWCYGCADGSYVTGVVPRVEANYEAYAGL